MEFDNKIYFCFIFLTVFVISNSNAQYRLNKTKYNRHDYVHKPEDPYNPTLCGFASYFVPGLGQMISGEYGRGFLFAGGEVVSISIVFYGAITKVEEFRNNQTNADEIIGDNFMTFGLFSYSVIKIWDIIDAVRVAKVNNLAFRDRKGDASTLRIFPFYVQQSVKDFQLPIGASLIFTF